MTTLKPLTPARAYSYEGSLEVYKLVFPDVQRFADQVERMRLNLKANNLTKTVDLADGSTVFVVAMEHVTSVHAVCPPPGEYEYLKKYPKREYVFTGRGVPDYVCGAVLSRVIETVEIGTDPKTGEPIEQDQVTNVKLTDLGVKRHPMEIAKPKLAIPENQAFVSKLGTAGDTTRYSQHHNIRPGLYTGTMRKMIQILLGIGKQTQDTYERRDPDLRVSGGTLWEIEYSTIGEYLEKQLNIQVKAKTAENNSAYNLYDPAKTSQSVDVEVYYDWRFNRTHGVHIGKKRVGDEVVPCAYVVEVGQRGVSAWALDLDPISTTPKGRDQYRKVLPELFEEDETNQGLFDKLGGFPTAYSAPRSTEAFERLVRAGEIVQGLDPAGVTDFYSKLPFSTALGWAFNDEGTAAHNTCYSYHESHLKLGHHYMLTLTAEPLAEEIEPAPNSEALILALMLTKTWERNKARRLTEEQIDAIFDAADPEDPEAMADAFDDAVAQPSFKFTAKLQELSKGFLYHPARLVPKDCGRPSGQPQFKVWEPVLDCMVSFDFGVDPEFKPKDPPLCNAPLFVCFNNQGGLTVLNYFLNPQDGAWIEHENTREECQYEGTWTETYYVDKLRDAGNFYCNDWDPREVIPAYGDWVQTTTGTFLGTNVCFQFYDYFGMCCQVELNYYHSFFSTRVTTGSRGMLVSTAVPKGDRSFLYMAKYSNVHDQITTTSQSGTQFSGHGAEYSVGIIYEFVFHWQGSACPTEEDNCPEQDYVCNMRPVCPQYRPHAFSCFDGRPDFPEYKLVCKGGHVTRSEVPNQTIYYGRCDGDVPQIPGWSEASDPIHTYEIEVRVFGDHALHGHRVHYHKVSGPDVDDYDLLMSRWWLNPSPDACDNRAYLHVNQSHFGTGVMGYEPQFDANAKFHGVPESMHVGLQSCYVGYLSEDA